MFKIIATALNSRIEPQTKQTPLHQAAEHGQLEVSKTLLSLKADINAMDNVRLTLIIPIKVC